MDKGIMKTCQKIPSLIEKLEVRQRRKAKLRLYIENGVKRLFHNLPTGLLILLLLISIYVATWKVADTIALLTAPIPAFIPVIKCLVRVLLFMLTTLFVAGFLYLFGTPRKAREIESGLATAFKIPNEYLYRCPFLVSQWPIKGTTATEYTFWTRLIPLDHWNIPDNKQAVLWALCAHSDEKFKAGNQKHTVTIVASSGITPKERETPQDPLFM